MDPAVRQKIQGWPVHVGYIYVYSESQMTACNTISEGYMNIDIIFAAIVLKFKVQGGWLV